jgi:hypothetical protein
MEKNKNKRIEWIEVNGKAILQLDFSRATAEESLELLEIFKNVMATQGPSSVRLLSKVVETDYDPSIARQWKQACFQHDDKIRASAVYGAGVLTDMAVRGFVEARRLLGLSEANAPRIFSDAKSAREWLSRQ